MTEGKESVQRGFEVSEADAKWIFVAGGSLIVAAVIMGLSLSAYFHALAHRLAAVPVLSTEIDQVKQRHFSSGPQLQTNEAADLKMYLERQQKLLSGYGWIDRARGVVRIPLDRAIEILTQTPGPAK